MIWTKSRIRKDCLTLLVIHVFTAAFALQSFNPSKEEECTAPQEKYLNALADSYIDRANVDGVTVCYVVEDVLLYTVPLGLPVSVLVGEDFLRNLYGSEVELASRPRYDGWSISVNNGRLRVIETYMFSRPQIIATLGLKAAEAAYVLPEQTDFYFLLIDTPFESSQ